MTENLPWQALRILCNGLSILDVPKLDLKSESEAHQFLVTYGFDLFVPQHVDQVWKLYSNACDFLEQSICKDAIEFPKELRDRESIGDFKRLLLSASGVEIEGFKLSSKRYQLWVCALLRVMHTMTHLQSDLRLKYLKKVKSQTIGRFEAHIQKTIVDGKETIVLGFERDKVPLFDFQKKESKVRESLLLKLLHKSESIAQEIYDHLGVRFITHNRAHAVWVMSYLVRHHLISYANAMPSRVRNTLVALDQFEAAISDGKLPQVPLDDLESFRDFDKEFGTPQQTGRDNKFSDTNYNSIQFTCRPLIRIPMLKKGVRSEMSFFFPFEVQILDKDSYKQTLGGSADHQVYKKKQLEAVRQRVLRGLV